MLIVASLLLPIASVAGLTGSELLKNCNITLKLLDADSNQIDSNSSLAMGLCLGYLNGIDDMHFFSAAYEANLPNPSEDKNYISEIKKHYIYCEPDNVTTLQKVGVVVKYLKNNPKFLNAPLEFIVVKALKVSFPCKY